MIRPRIVGLIFRKDLVDAMRDSRVAISVLLPVLLGFAYNLLFQDQPRTTVNLAYVAPDQVALVETLKARVPSGIELKIEQVADEAAARARVAKDGGLALVFSAGFDAAVRQGASPALGVFTRDPPGGGVTTTLLILDGVLRAEAGQRPPATVRTERVATEGTQVGLIQELGLRRYMVLGTLIMLVGFIAIIVVPILLAEEKEKRTLEALTLVASDVEVVIAKAFVGLAYIAVAVPALLLVTRIVPADVPLFVAGVAALAIATVGIGLLLGGIFRSASQAYTWSGFFLMPFLFPPFFVGGTDMAPAAKTLLDTQATTHGMKLAANAVIGKAIFPDATLPAFGVIAAWAAVAYALLVWRMRAARD